MAARETKMSLQLTEGNWGTFGKDPMLCTKYEFRVFGEFWKEVAKGMTDGQTVGETDRIARVLARCLPKPPIHPEMAKLTAIVKKAKKVRAVGALS